MQVYLITHKEPDGEMLMATVDALNLDNAWRSWVQIDHLDSAWEKYNRSSFYHGPPPPIPAPEYWRIKICACPAGWKPLEYWKKRGPRPFTRQRPLVAGDFAHFDATGVWHMTRAEHVTKHDGYHNMIGEPCAMRLTAAGTTLKPVHIVTELQEGP